MISEVKPEYVDYIPDQITDENKLYICKQFNIVVHLCACGCGLETITPIDKKGWKLIEKKNNVVSLEPSIGNFRYKCKSHYRIIDNQIVWC